MSDDEGDGAESAAAGSGSPASDEPGHHDPAATPYSRGAVVGSAIVGLAVAFLAVTWAAGSAVFHEELFRTAPTVERGGIGSDWVIGNTVPALDFLIALVHAADVIMGVFILVMVFVHWASFRRIAARMQAPGGAREPGEVAADGGSAPDAGPDGRRGDAADQGGESA